MFSAVEELNFANKIVCDDTATWADGALVNTEVDVDVALPQMISRNGLYLITVNNPSPDTDLTVLIKGKETFGASVVYPAFASFPLSVPAGEAASVVIHGWMIGEGGRLTLSNDSALGAGQGFPANVRVRKV